MSISTSSSPLLLLSKPYNSDLYASIDMGTNSFKLLILQVDLSTGKFLSFKQIKRPVLLGQSGSSTTGSTKCLSGQSQSAALSALQDFLQCLNLYRVENCWAVATSAVREAENKDEFVMRVKEEVGLDVEVLSGEEEGRYIYSGIIRFVPCLDKTVLCIDIGGGSTEFIVGRNGIVLYVNSVPLGHVTLTDEFVKRGAVGGMKEYVRRVLEESGLVERIKGFEIDLVVGSSGTIRSLEIAVLSGYGNGSGLVNMSSFLQKVMRNRRFNREELTCVVESLCEEEDSVKRDVFFKKRSEFIVAGAVLLQELFGVLGIEEMEVSRYALGEGVIATKLAVDCGDYDFNVNAKWHSVVRFATRLNNKKQMNRATQCAGIAKDIFGGLRKCYELEDISKTNLVSFSDKDVEYLEVACLLHNVGHFTGEKGYHKQSYSIIMNGEHIQGYAPEEINVIALLARHHRKKFPKMESAKFEEFSKEAKQRFKILCAIIRISVVVQQCLSNSFQGVRLTYSKEGLKMLLGEAKNPAGVCSADVARKHSEDLCQNQEYFEKVSRKKLTILFPEST